MQLVRLTQSITHVCPINVNFKDENYLLFIFSSAERCVNLCLFLGAGLVSGIAVLQLGVCRPSFTSVAAAICCRICAFLDAGNILNALIWSDLGTVAIIIFVEAILNASQRPPSDIYLFGEG